MPINETASIGILNGGRADSILNMKLKLPFPNRHPRELINSVVAAQSYGLRYVVVTRNPFMTAIIHTTFHSQHASLHVVRSLDAAWQRIRQLRAEQDIQVKM